VRENLRGSIIFEPEDFGFIPILRCLYELESSRVSGPTSNMCKFTDSIWTEDELVAYVKRRSLDSTLVNDLINKMLDTHQIIEIPAYDEMPPRYLSRLGETIRLLGHTYEYWHRGWPTIKASRWVIEDKSVPQRTIPVKEFISRLQDKISNELDEEFNTENLRIAIAIVLEAVAKHIIQKVADWEKVSFSEFQYEAIESMIIAQYKQNQPGRKIKRTHVLTAGVGAGKTYAFAIPLVVSALEAILHGPAHENVNLFLYPRTALAKNQFEVMQSIVKYIRNKRLHLHFEHASNPIYKKSVRKGIQKIYTYSTPHIIITTLETLKRRLQHPLFVQGINRVGLSRVVLDEIHLVSGLTGTKTSRLMARLNASFATENQILWTAASATIASPDFHVSKVFGVHESDVHIIEPMPDNVEKVGLAHHVFLRVTDGVSHIGTLVNATSILLHNRRQSLANRSSEVRQRTIGFADTLDALGRWNADFRENERTEGIKYWKDSGHPEIDDPNRWSSRHRELPYALRYLEPFSRRIQVLPDKSDVYTPILSGCNIMNPCQQCRNGERLDLGLIDSDELRELGRLVYRKPADPNDNVIPYEIINPAFRTNNPISVGTLDRCPFLEAGACHWFPEIDFSVDSIPGNKHNYLWRNAGRSKIHSSKTKIDDKEFDGDFEDIVYSGSTREFYDVYPDGNAIPCDIVLASPSLEVGIDIGDITESIMYKAIRNVASYRQKAGRVGRERGTDTLNITLLVENPVDLHYYRQPMKLTSKGHLDPVPLEDSNELILENALYSGVWDYLACEGVLPEAIPLPEGLFSKKLQHCLDLLDESNDNVIHHLLAISRVRNWKDISDEQQKSIHDAIQQVRDELVFLLTDVSSSFNTNGIDTNADIVRYVLAEGLTPSIDSAILDARDEIDDLTDSFRTRRANIDPIKLGIAQEIFEIDSLVECGWNPDILEENYLSFEVKIKELKGLNEREIRQIDTMVENLKDIHSELLQIQNSGMNPLVLEFYRQFKLYASDKNTRRKAYYLSYIMTDLKVFSGLKMRSSFVRPENLFSHPHEEKVRIIRKSLNNQSILGEEEIQVSESLFGYLPGTWTFRLGKHPFKTKVGNLSGSVNQILEASLSQMTKVGHRFLQEEGEYTIPFRRDLKMKLYRPVQLEVQQCRKLIPKKDGSAVLSDGDESEYRGNESRLTVPRAFASKWVDIQLTRGQSISANKYGLDTIELESGEDNNSDDRTDALQFIKHPLFANLIEDISWQEQMRVSEMVYEVQRIYNSADVSGAIIRYVAHDRPAALGRRLITEGICIDLKAKHFQKVIDEIAMKILSGEKEWLPSSIKMIEAALAVLGSDSANVNSFIVRDLINAVVANIVLDSDFKENKPIIDTVRNIIENPDFEQKIQDVLKSGPTLISDDLDPEEMEDSAWKRTKELIMKRSEAVLSLSKNLADILDDLESFVREWVAYTLTNTLGSVALSSLRRFAGVQEFDVGYSIDVDRDANRYRVILYDDNHQGNGSSAVVRDYLHILHIQRHSDRATKYLPTYDYLSILEENLMQCSQFHQDLNALRMYEEETHNENPTGYPELAYVRSFSADIFDIGKQTWNAMGIRGPEDAWKLPLARRVRKLLDSHHPQLNEDDLLRSTGICWNGCPECVDENGGALSSIARGAFIDKYVLDYWFELGITETKEYSLDTLQQIAKGAMFKQMGLPTRVKMRTENLTMRAVHLPHTVGFNISRTIDLRAQKYLARMLIRTSDMHGLEAVKPSDEQYPIPREGFDRLVWFTLLMSSYLDCVGFLAPKDKSIDLVFYTATQVPVNKTGLSSSLLQTIDYFRKEHGFHEPLENLSDVLNWLAESGFKIRLCISEETKDNPYTENLLQNLDLNANLELYVAKHVRMHKKTLVTPLGAVTGSSNLTKGGTEWNVETVHYTKPKTSAYDATRITANDTITDHGSKLDLIMDV